MNRFRTELKSKNSPKCLIAWYYTVQNHICLILASTLRFGLICFSLEFIVPKSGSREQKKAKFSMHANSSSESAPLARLARGSGCGPPALGCRYGFEWFWAKTCREFVIVLHLIFAPKPHELCGNLVFYNPYYIYDKTTENFSIKLNFTFRQSSTITSRWPVTFFQSQDASKTRKHTRVVYLISAKRSVSGPLLFQNCFPNTFSDKTGESDFGCFDFLCEKNNMFTHHEITIIWAGHVILTGFQHRWIKECQNK